MSSGDQLQELNHGKEEGKQIVDNETKQLLKKYITVKSNCITEIIKNADKEMAYQKEVEFVRNYISVTKKIKL
jgi:ribosomal protein S18